MGAVVFVGRALGALFLAVGAGLFVYGSPYYMLDWGAGFLISGSVLVSGGLIALLLAGALSRLDAMQRGQMLAGLAAATRIEPSAPVSGGQAAGPQATEDKDSAGVSVAPAIAGAAAGAGLAVAARSILGAVSPPEPDPVEEASRAVDQASAEVEAAVERVDAAVRDIALVHADEPPPETMDAIEAATAANETFEADPYADLRADLTAPAAVPDDDTEMAVDDASVEIDAGTPAPAEPSASDEGVIAAYSVGDSAFTMYADGRILARTPEGEFTFASMDELKAFMAERRSA